MRWTCRRCGEEHEGLPLDLAFDAPAYWYALSEEERTSPTVLGDDLCVIGNEDGTDFFIRGVLPIPVPDLADDFVYGVWTTLSERSYRRVLDLWDDPRRMDEPPYFGWLSNRIPGYPDTLNLKARVQTRSLDRRPTIELEPSDHPLALEQAHGISEARVREIVELNMHGAA
jgi:hypothetical protein